MRLIKSVMYRGRLLNEETSECIGKCTTRDNRYWYQDINSNIIRKDTYPTNKYDITKEYNNIYYL